MESTIVSIRPLPNRLGVTPTKHFLVLRGLIKKPVKGDVSGRDWKAALEISHGMDVPIEVRRNCIFPCFRTLVASGVLTTDDVEKPMSREGQPPGVAKVQVQLSMGSNEHRQNPLCLEFEMKVPIHQPSGVGQNGTSRVDLPSAPSNTPLTAEALSRLEATYAREASVTSYPLSTFSEPPATTPLSKVSTSSGSSTTNPADNFVSPTIPPPMPALGRPHSTMSSRHEANYRLSPLKAKDQRFLPQDETPEQDISDIPSRPSNPVPPLETSPGSTPMNQVGIEDDFPPTPSNSIASESSSSYSMSSAPLSEYNRQDSLHDLRELRILQLVGPPALTPPVIAGSLSQQPTLTNASQMTLIDRNTTGRDVLPPTRRSSSGTVSRREARSDEPVPEVEVPLPLPHGLQRQPSTVASRSSLTSTRGSRSSALPDSSRAGSRMTDLGGKKPTPSAPSISQRTSSKGSSHRVPVPVLEPDSLPPMPNGMRQHAPVTPPAVSNTSPILPPLSTEPVLRDSPRRKTTGSSEQGARSSPASTPSISRRSSSRTSTRYATPVAELEDPPPMPNGTPQQHTLVAHLQTLTPPPSRPATAHSIRDSTSGMSGEAKVAQQGDSPPSGPSISRTSSKRSTHGAERSTPPVLEHENLPPKPDKSYRQKPVALSLQPDIHPRRSNERLPRKEVVSSDLDTRRQDTPSASSSISRSFSRRSTRRATPAQDLTDQPPLPNDLSRPLPDSLPTSTTTAFAKKAPQSPPSGTNTSKGEGSTTRRSTSSKKSSQHVATSTAEQATDGSHQQRVPPMGRSGSVPSLKDSVFSHFSPQSNGRNHHVGSPVASSSIRPPRRESRDSEPKFDTPSGNE